jgi:type VI protein secretion system component VasK
MGMKGLVKLIYLILAASMLIFAAPQLHVEQGWSLQTVFSIIWLALALTVIAAHLHGVLKVDQEVKTRVKLLERVKSSL